MFQQINEDVIIKIKVIPKASCNEIVEWEGDVLKIRLKAVPEKGKANAELIKFLAAFFHLAKSNVRLVTGDASRQKKIRICGIELKEIQNLINAALTKRKLE